MKIGSSSRVSALHPTPRVISESFLKSFKIISLPTLFYLRNVKTLFIKVKTFFCAVFFSKILQNLSILKLKAFEDSLEEYKREISKTFRDDLLSEVEFLGNFREILISMEGSIMILLQGLIFQTFHKICKIPKINHSCNANFKARDKIKTQKKSQ